jgi:hypothetical protein
MKITQPPISTMKLDSIKLIRINQINEVRIKHNQTIKFQIKVANKNQKMI